MTISYSAPGKVILSGEHSVVHAKPAIASAFNLRLTFSVEKSSSPDSKNPDFAHISAIDTVVQNYLTDQKIPFQKTPFRFNINSQIPIGQGFGSSAALSAAASACLVELYTGQTVEQFSKNRLNEIVFAAEHHFHGTPSGIDNTASVFGGLVFLRKEFSFLSLMQRLNFSIPAEIQSRLFIVHLGDRAESTKELVQMVQSKTQNDPANMKKAWQDFEKTTRQFVVAMYENQPDLLTKAMRKNHNLLTKIGVVSPHSLKLIHQLQDFGEVKITGAGGILKGSGYGIVFCTEGKQAKLEKFFKSKSLVYFPFLADADGVLKVV